MGRKKKHTSSHSGPGASEDKSQMKEKDTGRSDRGLQRYLKNNGIDLDSIKPKMEQYSNLLQWNKDSIAYQMAKIEALKKATELYNTIGGKAAEFQTEIMRLSYFLDMMEKKLLEENKNPLESSDYQKALKLKKDLLVEYKKLGIDYGRAVTDYKYKKSQHPDMGDDDLFTVQE